MSDLTLLVKEWKGKFKLKKKKIQGFSFSCLLKTGEWPNEWNIGMYERVGLSVEACMKGNYTTYI